MRGYLAFGIIAILILGLGLGAAGVRIAPVEPLVVFVQVRYLVRFTPEGWMSGPVYEGGLGIGF